MWISKNAKQRVFTIYLQRSVPIQPNTSKILPKNWQLPYPCWAAASSTRPRRSAPQLSRVLQTGAVSRVLPQNRPERLCPNAELGTGSCNSPPALRRSCNLTDAPTPAPSPAPTTTPTAGPTLAPTPVIYHQLQNIEVLIFFDCFSATFSKKNQTVF